MSDEIKNECYKALGCLYIAVPEEVADGVNKKVKLHIDALEAKNEKLVKALEWAMRNLHITFIYGGPQADAKEFKEARAALEEVKK